MTGRSHRSHRTVELIQQLMDNERPEFVSFTYTAKRSGELARHTLLLGQSIESLYQGDLVVLADALPALTGIDRQAALALIASRRLSLDVGIGNHPDNVNKDTYHRLPSGLLVHRLTKEVYVHAVSVHKKVLRAGTYPERNRGELAAAKNRLTRHLPSGKLRQFDLGLVEAARLRGATLILQRRGDAL